MRMIHWGMLLVLCVLILAEIIAHALPRGVKSRDEIIIRIHTWWWIIGFFSLALLTPPRWALVALGLLSFLALKEFITINPFRNEDRWAFIWAYIAIPGQYYLIGDSWYNMFLAFIPVYIFLLVPTRLVLAGSPQGFLRSAATLQWGLMTTVFMLSHMGQLRMMPDHSNNGHLITGAEMLFFLFFVTQFNDVAQFIWGKSLGRHKIIPKISPNKTWEGFLGGVSTTVIASMLLAPWFTPYSLLPAAGLGLILGVSGFLGDVVMSAVKRDLGIKDTGAILPGHGGILDRLDSLIFTAPLFFHITKYLYF